MPGAVNAPGFLGAGSNPMAAAQPPQVSTKSGNSLALRCSPGGGMCLRQPQQYLACEMLVCSQGRDS